jgi:hypothetical protein
VVLMSSCPSMSCDVGRHAVEDGVGGEDVPLSALTVCSLVRVAIVLGWAIVLSGLSLRGLSLFGIACLVHADEPDQPGSWPAVVWAGADAADGGYQVASGEDVLDAELQAWLSCADLADGLADALGAGYFRMGVAGPVRAEDFEGDGWVSGVSHLEVPGDDIGCCVISAGHHGLPFQGGFRGRQPPDGGCLAGQVAQSGDLVVLGGEPGQGPGTEAGQVADIAGRLGKAFFERVDLVPEPRDLGVTAVGLLAILLERLEPLLEFGA